MVMDVTPDPQFVGLEFVRQYYTLLNQAPTHVHRFYNKMSSFVHGGLDVFNLDPLKPAVGQEEIHRCIQRLNFRDCKAKITQVDSQNTLGNGIVVQVTGELSNGGEPMRRFTQTFVLGYHAPKQFYVHNDIFRYQDVVFPPSEDVEQETHHYELEEEEPEHPPEPEILQEPAQIEPSQYYCNAAPPMPIVNGTLHMEEPQVVAPRPPSPPPNDMYGNMHETDQSEECEPEEELPPAPEPKPVDDYSPTHIKEQPPLDNNVSSNEPKTYATLLKSGGGVSSFSNSPNSVHKSPPSPPLSMTRLESRNDSSSILGGRGMRPGGARGGPPRGALGRNSVRTSPPEVNRTYGGREEGGMDVERRRSVNSQNQYTDDHQLFIGNLPLNATENDLKELFETFGTIVDLRIMYKPNNGTKGSNGSKLPNYGFIIFESTQAAQACLNARPIVYPDEIGTIVNVEEKKFKHRSEGGGRGGMRGSMPRGGQRGGFTRGGGGMRPGGGFAQRGAPR